MTFAVERPRVCKGPCGRLLAADRFYRANRKTTENTGKVYRQGTCAYCWNARSLERRDKAQHAERAAKWFRDHYRADPAFRRKSLAKHRDWLRRRAEVREWKRAIREETAA